MKRYISLFVFLIFSIITINSQTKFSVKAPSQVIEGQRFRIVYTLTNGDGEDLKVPEFEGITNLYGPARSQSSQITIINGKTTSTKDESYTYTVVAPKQGTYTIPSATIKSDGKEYSSNSVTIKVLPDDGTSANASQSNGIRSTNQTIGEEKIFARMILSKSSAYEQEPILVTFKVYAKGANIVSLNNANFPTFENFVLQDIPIKNPQIELEHYNGENYQVVAIKKALLYPQKSGKIEISKGDIDVVVQVIRPVQGFFGIGQGYVEEERKLSIPSTAVNIKSLPTDKPSSYINAVGKNFTIKSTLSSTNTKVNDALTYKLVIAGNGNINYIKEPEIKFPADFEVYDPKIDIYSEPTSSGVEGSKTIEYILIPRSAGNFKIPSIDFSYFNLATNSYKTVTADGYELKVEKGASTQGETIADFTNKEDLKVLAKDIRYLKTNNFELSKETKPIFGTFIYWIYYIVPLLIFITYIIINRKQAQLSSNIELLKNKKANKVATKRLKLARAYLKDHNKEMFYAELLKAVWGYISDKLTIPLSELSKENISNELRNYGAGDEIVEKIINVINSCEFAQYAPSQDDQIMDRLYNDVVDIIGNMEDVVRNR